MIAKMCACGQEIPAERLEVFPDATACAGCSTVGKNKVFMEYGHKTAGALVIVDWADKESIRKANRAFRRSR